MSILRSLLGGEGRATIESPRVPLTAATLGDYASGPPTLAGVNVSPELAMHYGPFYRGVAIIAGTCAGLPLVVYKRGTRDRLEVPLLDSPHKDMEPFGLWELTYLQRILWGNAYLQKMRNVNGEIVELLPMRPDKVRPGRASDGSKVYEVTTDSGEVRGYNDHQVLHLPGLGYDGICGLSVVTLARNGIGLGLAAEEAAGRLFVNGSMLGGVVTTEHKLDQAQADALKARWRAKVSGVQAAHDIAVLDDGAKFQPVSINPKDAQWLESRRFSVADQARWLGLPPHMLGDVERSTSWGTGIEQQNIAMVTYTLQPWLQRTEQRVTRQLVRGDTPGSLTRFGGLGLDAYAEYAREGLLRGDTATRYQAYAVGRQWGWLSTNDIRRRENLPPIDGGDDDFLTPLNMVTHGDTPAMTGATDAAAG